MPAAGLLAAISVLIFAVTWFTRAPDPKYNGRRLSSHLYKGHAPLVLAGLPSSNQLALLRNRYGETSEALRALGPEAVPLLDEWLRTTDQPWRASIAKLLQKRQINWPWFSAPSRRYMAFRALWDVRGHATLVTPTLLEIAKTGSLREQSEALIGLDMILNSAPDKDRDWILDQVEPCVETIISMAQSRPSNAAIENLLTTVYRYRPPADKEKTVIRLLSLDPPIADQVIDSLDRNGQMRNMGYLNYPGEDPTGLKVGAAIFFRDAPVLPEKVVPLLMRGLDSTNCALIERCAQALGAYGVHSVETLPKLSNLVSHPRPYVAKAAIEAIEKINAARDHKMME